MQVESTPVHRVNAPVVAHPGWCDPRRCVESDGDIEHCSAPVVLRTQDACLELAWVRGDVSGEAGAQPGATELRIDIRYEAPGARAQLFLTPREVREFGNELLRCCWRERCGRGRQLRLRSAGVVAS